VTSSVQSKNRSHWLRFHLDGFVAKEITVPSK